MIPRVRTLVAFALAPVGLAAVAVPAAAQTTITSVYCGRSLCPNPIRLAAGQSMTVSLRGQGLGDITSGAVVSGRLTNQDVRVSLGTVGLRGTSRPVTLSAASGAAGAEGLGLSFTLRTRMSISAPVGVAIAPQLVTSPTRTLSSDPATSVEPTLDSATPRTLVLYPGQTADVVLSGNNLSGYRSGSVTRGGTPVSGLSATVTRAETDFLMVRLAADPSVQSNSSLFGAPLELVLLGPPNLTAPVEFEVRSVLEQLDSADWSAVVSSALQGATFAFNSCGPSNADRTFSVRLPAVSYAADGSVPRLEYRMDFAERLSFLEMHSLDPTDKNEVQWGSFTSTEHPTSMSHTVTRVRMCVGNVTSMNNWSAIGIGPGPNGVTTGQIEWSFPDVLLIGRGMPADPTGNVEGIDVGMGWGDDIMNTEIPDRSQSLRVRILIDLTLESGVVTYGLREQVVESNGRWLPGPGRSGTSMPPSVQLSLERFASDRVQQVRAEIQRAMLAPGTRAAISSAIQARLGS